MASGDNEVYLRKPYFYKPDDFQEPCCKFHGMGTDHGCGTTGRKPQTDTTGCSIRAIRPNPMNLLWPLHNGFQHKIHQYPLSNMGYLKWQNSILLKSALSYLPIGYQYRRSRLLWNSVAIRQNLNGLKGILVYWDQPRADHCKWLRHSSGHKH